MKALLTTLNAKYIHTSLGLWYLYQYARRDFPQLLLREYNINQNPEWICAQIYAEHADVVAFSCNIWNIRLTLDLAQRVKQLAPQTAIVFGGPEATNDAVKLIQEQWFVDYIVCGEGEVTFKELLTALADSTADFGRIPGLAWRSDGQAILNEPRSEIADLSEIPYPYPEDIDFLSNRLVYYETARGCPYNCQYCLSSNEGNLRFFPLERVKQDLQRFGELGVNQVKLVDRSFNCNREWAKEIWRFLLQYPSTTNYHFEIVGDLLDDESLEILREAPKGFFQFEIGVQSTNPATLDAIQRRMNQTKLFEQVGKLIKFNNIHIHLDLIAGLPYEDYQSFGKSFDDVLALRPHQLQLGFLKLLKSSGLRARAAEYGYKYIQEAPYEILSSEWLSYEDLCRLKVIEDLLENYYNSGRFRTSLEYLFAHFGSPFVFFEKFAGWWKKQGLDELAHKTRDLYVFLYDFAMASEAIETIIRNLLKYDLLSQERLAEIPAWCGNDDLELQRRGYDFWRNPDNIERYVPESAAAEIREIQRKVRFAEFDFNPECFLQQSIESTQSIVMKKTIFLFVYRRNEVRNYLLEKLN